MTRDELTELLKIHKSLKAGIAAYERSRHIKDPFDRYAAAPSRVADYSGMPFGGAPGSRPPTMTGEWGFEDYLQYSLFSDAVYWVEQALDALTADERLVITKKWMEGLTLHQISQVSTYSVRTVKTIHTRALDKMHNCLQFVADPIGKKSKETVA